MNQGEGIPKELIARIVRDWALKPGDLVTRRRSFTSSPNDLIGVVVGVTELPNWDKRFIVAWSTSTGELAVEADVSSEKITLLSDPD